MSSNCEIEFKDNQISTVVFAEKDIIEVYDVGSRGERGLDGAAGPVSFYSGLIVPSDSLGVDGATYINIDDGKVYKKAFGTWSIVGSIKSDSNVRVETITLTSDQIIAKAIVLNELPAPAEKTIVSVQSGPTQYYGVDFMVSGNILHWEGLSFELTLEIGSNIIVQYLT